MSGVVWLSVPEGLHAKGWYLSDTTGRWWNLSTVESNRRSLSHWCVPSQELRHPILFSPSFLSYELNHMFWHMFPWCTTLISAQSNETSSHGADSWARVVSWCLNLFSHNNPMLIPWTKDMNRKLSNKNRQKNKSRRLISPVNTEIQNQSIAERTLHIHQSSCHPHVTH